MLNYKLLGRILDVTKKGEHKFIKIQYLGLGKGGKEAEISTSFLLGCDIPENITPITVCEFSYEATPGTEKKTNLLKVVAIRAVGGKLSGIDSSEIELSGEVTDVEIVSNKDSAKLLGYLFKVNGLYTRLWLDDFDEDVANKIRFSFDRLSFESRFHGTAIPITQPQYDEFAQRIPGSGSVTIFRVTGINSEKLAPGIFGDDEGEFDEEKAFEDLDSLFSEDEIGEPKEFKENNSKEVREEQESMSKCELPPMDPVQAFQYRITTISLVKELVAAKPDDEELKEFMIYLIGRYER